MKLIFATRASALARRQTYWVMQALQVAYPGLTCEEMVIQTQGDKDLEQPLPHIAGKGLFTHELEKALFSGAATCAVHSLKDLPIDDPEGLTVACIPARADVREVLISKDDYTWQSLPGGALVGTSSLRRTAQLLALRPDVSVVPLRGNIDTRIHKAQEGKYHAIILAGAGLLRLGLERYVTQWLSLDIMLPAPGQGALAVQCRVDDADTIGLLFCLEDPPTRLAVTAERQFLRALGGGCSLPVAAHATASSNPSSIHLTGLVASLDGKRVIKVLSEGNDPIELGNTLACIAIDQGAGEILVMNTEGDIS